MTGVRKHPCSRAWQVSFCGGHWHHWRHRTDVIGLVWRQGAILWHWWEIIADTGSFAPSNAQLVGTVLFLVSRNCGHKDASVTIQHDSGFKVLSFFVWYFMPFLMMSYWAISYSDRQKLLNNYFWSINKEYKWYVILQFPLTYKAFQCNYKLIMRMAHQGMR